jgi:thiol-disulfide isomerase/thioredoxin
MLDPSMLASQFAQALAYGPYLGTAKPHERGNWDAFHARVRLTDPQSRLLAGFNRRLNVLVLSGTWCGDCVQQVPMLDHIARASGGAVDLRLLDRDENPQLASAVRVCGGGRVPVVVFMNEDHEFVAFAGDRTLSRYRVLAARQLGVSCPLPGAPVPADEIAATLQDWVDEFERVHLLLRLSPKLRQRHAD